MFLNNIMSIRLKKMVYQTRPANKLKLNPNMKNEKEPDKKLNSVVYLSYKCCQSVCKSLLLSEIGLR